MEYREIMRGCQLHCVASISERGTRHRPKRKGFYCDGNIVAFSRMFSSSPQNLPHILHGFVECYEILLRKQRYKLGTSGDTTASDHDSKSLWQSYARAQKPPLPTALASLRHRHRWKGEHAINSTDGTRQINNRATTAANGISEGPDFC